MPFQLPTPDSIQSSYERIGARLQRLISNPKVQKTQTLIVSRLQGEDAEAWGQILCDLEETEGVQIEKLEAEFFCIRWRDHL
ncbi:hypothetical protein D3C71_1963260 [compost metagenome]